MAEASIQVHHQDGDQYEVTVEAGSTTRHRVELPVAYWEKLCRPGESREALIERSFRFLLERESNTSILPSFELSVISRYFPEFEQAIC